MKLGTGHVVQIFNMAKKEKLKDLSFTENVTYWKWISNKKIALVTATSVYHVDITNPNENQVKILDRYSVHFILQIRLNRCRKCLNYRLLC